MEIENLQHEPVIKSKFVNVAHYILLALFSWRLLAGLLSIFRQKPVVKQHSTLMNENMRAVLNFVSDNFYALSFLSVIITIAGLTFSYFFLQRREWARKGIIVILWYNVIATFLGLSATLYTILFMANAISDRLGQSPVSSDISLKFVYSPYSSV